MKEEIIEKIREYERIGIEHVIFMFPQKQEVEQTKLFAKEIMPKF